MGSLDHTLRKTTCLSLHFWYSVLLLLPPSLRLMLTIVFMDTVWEHMPDMDTQLTDTMERNLLMLSQRLMPTTMVMLDLMLMDTNHTDIQLMVTTERDPLILMLTMASMDTVLDMDILV